LKRQILLSTMASLFGLLAEEAIFIQNICSYFLDTVVQFSIIPIVMLHLGRFISVVLRPASLEIQGFASGLYELRELSAVREAVNTVLIILKYFLIICNRLLVLFSLNHQVIKCWFS
jgi:hypothetical protein